MKTYKQKKGLSKFLFFHLLMY